MTTEEKLRHLILSKYKSIREFTLEADIPYTTMDSILRRGVGNSSVDNIIKVCNTLRISVDALARGEIQYYIETIPTDTVDIKDIIADTKAKLSTSDHLVVDGKIIDIEYTEPIISALDIGYEMVKQKSKKVDA